MAKLGNSAFVPQRLTQARSSFAMSKKDLAQLAAVSANSISTYERGECAPMDATIERIGEVLRFPVDFFTTPAPEEDVSCVFWRAQKTDTMRSQERTQVRIQWAGEMFQALNEIVEFPELKLSAVSKKHWRNVEAEDIEELAEACRAAWGMGDYPIPDMTLAIENCGIPVLSLDTSSYKQSGFMFWSERLGRPLIGTNNVDASLGRMRFNLAHELGHVLLHQSVEQRELRSPKDHALVEGQAHRFASALLFPRRAFERRVRYATIEEFASLKREWGMTICAQIARASDLGLCSKVRTEELWRAAGRRGFRRPLGEPFDSDMPLEAPRMFKRAIDLLETSAKEMLEAVRRWVPIPLSDAEAIVGRKWPSFDQELGPNVVRLRAH